MTDYGIPLSPIVLEAPRPLSQVLARAGDEHRRWLNLYHETHYNERVGGYSKPWAWNPEQEYHDEAWWYMKQLAIDALYMEALAA